MFAGRLQSVVTFLFVVALFVVTPAPVQAMDFGRQLTVGDQTLYLNGQGPRKKAFLTVYNIALYLTEQGSNGRAIIEADHPMALNLVVRSRFATAERISEAFRLGLDRSTRGQTQDIRVQSKAFLDVFDAGVVKDDRFEFAYLPGNGTRISKNGARQVTIPGLAFKQALFGIWLSAAPVSNKLRAQLLGQR